MADHDDLPTDELLRSAFDRVVELADVATPPAAELEGRVVGLADRQARAQRRTALGAAAAVLVVVGIVAALLGTSSRADRDGGVATAPTSTSAPIDPISAASNTPRTCTKPARAKWSWIAAGSSARENARPSSRPVRSICDGSYTGFPAYMARTTGSHATR